MAHRGPPDAPRTPLFENSQAGPLFNTPPPPLQLHTGASEAGFLPRMYGAGGLFDVNLWETEEVVGAISLGALATLRKPNEVCHYMFIGMQLPTMLLAPRSRPWVLDKRIDIVKPTLSSPQKLAPQPPPLSPIPPGSTLSPVDDTPELLVAWQQTISPVTATVLPETLLSWQQNSKTKRHRTHRHSHLTSPPVPATLSAVAVLAKEANKRKHGPSNINAVAVANDGGAALYPLAKSNRMDQEEREEGWNGEEDEKKGDEGDSEPTQDLDGDDGDESYRGNESQRRGKKKNTAVDGPARLPNTIRQPRMGNFACSKGGCSARFANAKLLKVHVNGVHAKTKDFKCEWPGCNAAFKWYNSLKGHKTAHENLKAFKCEVPGCTRAFNFRVDRKRHMAMHERQGPRKK